MKTLQNLEGTGISRLEGEEVYYSKKRPDEGLSIAYIKDKERFSISDEILLQMASTYRSVFGRDKRIDPSAWEEGFKCENCTNQKSLESAYGVDEWIPLKELESNYEPDLKCNDCDSQMSVFHKPEDIIATIKKHLDFFFAGFAFDQKNESQGFFYGYADTLEDICRELIYFYQQSSETTFEYLLNEIQKATGLSVHDNVFIFQEAAVELPFRNPAIFHGLSRGLFQEMPPAILQIPTIAMTEAEKKITIFIQASGHQQVYKPDDHPLIVYSAKNTQQVAEVITLPAQDFYNKYKNVVDDWAVNNKNKFA